MILLKIEEIIIFQKEKHTKSESFVLVLFNLYLFILKYLVIVCY